MKRILTMLALLMCLLPAVASADLWMKDNPDHKLTGEVILSGKTVELVGDGQPTDVWFVIKGVSKITLDNVNIETEHCVMKTSADGGIFWSEPLEIAFVGEQESILVSRTTNAIDTHRILTVSGGGATIQGGCGSKGGHGILGVNGDIFINASNMTICGGDASEQGGDGIRTDLADVTISGSDVKISGGSVKGANNSWSSIYGGYGIYTDYSASVTINGSHVEISGGSAQGRNAVGRYGVRCGDKLTIHDRDVTIRGGAASSDYNGAGGNAVFAGSRMEIIGAVAPDDDTGLENDESSSPKGVTLLGGTAQGYISSSGGEGVALSSIRDKLTISSENVLIRGGSGEKAMYNVTVELDGVAGFESEDGTEWAQDLTGTQGDLPWYKTGPIPPVSTSALPKTGDDSSMTLWALLLAMSVCALGLRRRHAT